MKIFISTIAIIGAMMFVAPQTVSAAAAIEFIEQENQPVVSANNNVLHVANANGMTVAIYNVTGVQVSIFKVEGVDRHYDLNLPKGCYIVKVGKTVRKIYIK